VDHHGRHAHKRIAPGSTDSSGGVHDVVTPVLHVIPHEQGRQDNRNELQIHVDFCSFGSVLEMGLIYLTLGLFAIDWLVLLGGGAVL